MEYNLQATISDEIFPFLINFSVEPISELLHLLENLKGRRGADSKRRPWHITDALTGSWKNAQFKLN
ncbi:hypothetical protein OAG15_00610 [bacterium]|nr:hypothetical protein [bacterium]